MPASRFRGNVLDVLQREGYIKGFTKLEIANNKNEFRIELKYVDGQPVIKAYLEFLNPAGEFILTLKICKETLMDLAFTFYRLLKAFYLIVKLELKVWGEKFYAKFSRRFLMSRSGRIPIAVPENTEVKVDGGVFFEGK